jgi:alkylation response protein AidB-like acyl-CoA dehydrogenase
VKRNHVGVAGAATATHVLDLTGDPHRLITAPDVQLLEAVDAARGLGHVTGEGEPASLDEDLLTRRAVVGTAAFLCGLARRQTDITVAYLKDRKQFGVAIGTFQGLKHPLAAAVVDVEFAWPAVLRAAHSLATGDPQVALHVSMAKAMASDSAYRLSRVCLQAHGAIGYTVEYDLHLFMKRTWALAKDWGTADQHRALIADAVLA